MQSVATRVEWSVCLSVGHKSKPYKKHTCKKRLNKNLKTLKREKRDRNKKTFLGVVQLYA